ncbi:hypothetical protein PGT21_022884 [Puccinia graminis f. sp. tritici]|uniref:VWFA domain-containing protein n=1 Tax=Puccinia graminis f. sp. tritici TaxID=56615 RepID=A0A5B0MJK2_PUCGR|nr:hypothetical protein PGT21_022884 [Puccinia graminis f. sp. tritici]
MHAPPPDYSVVDPQFAERHRYSVHPSLQARYNQQRQQQQHPLTNPNEPSPFRRTLSCSQSFQHQRLGRLVIGSGAASALNSLLSQTPASPLSYTNPSSGEDKLVILARYDTVLLIDDSALMSQQNRWNEAAVAVAGLADTLVKYNSDGIDVYFMNSNEHLRNATSAAEVTQLFRTVQPVGQSTPTDVRVEELLGVYLKRLEEARATNRAPIKPLNLIVITDGEGDDPDTLAHALAGFSDRLDLGRFPLTQLGVQFVQIGNDRDATRFLQALDDELKSELGGRRDIVDFTPYQGGVTTRFLIKALLGGINKFLV